MNKITKDQCLSKIIANDSSTQEFEIDEIIMMVDQLPNYNYISSDLSVLIEHTDFIIKEFFNLFNYLIKSLFYLSQTDCLRDNLDYALNFIKLISEYYELTISDNMIQIALSSSKIITADKQAMEQLDEDFNKIINLISKEDSNSQEKIEVLLLDVLDLSYALIIYYIESKMNDFIEFIFNIVIKSKNLQPEDYQNLMKTIETFEKFLDKNTFLFISDNNYTSKGEITNPNINNDFLERKQAIVESVLNLRSLFHKHRKKVNLLSQNYLANDSIINLYHYTDIDAIFSIFEKNELWVTHIDYLNDRHELKIFFDLIDDEIEKLPETSALKTFYSKKLKFGISLRKIIHELSNKTYNHPELNLIKEKFKLPAQIYILSLTIKEDDILMWSNYGSNYSGFNFGISLSDYIYNFNQNIKSDKCNFDLYTHDYVKYDSPINKDYIKNIESEIRKSKYHTENLIVSRVLFNIINKAIFYKNNGFKPENEYRFAFYQYDFNKNEKIRDIFRTSNNTIIPYSKIPIYNVNELVNRIYIGPFNKSETVVNGLDDFLSYLQLTSFETSSSSDSNINDIVKKSKLSIRR